MAGARRRRRQGVAATSARSCRWVAANTLLRNGDYIDEVFFYGTLEKGGGSKQEPRLHMMGWDYDTVLKPCHPVPIRYRCAPQGCIGREGGTPLQGAQRTPSHCPPDAKCRLQWHL